MTPRPNDAPREKTTISEEKKMPESEPVTVPPPDSRARRARRKALVLRTAGAVALLAAAAWGVKTLRFLSNHVVTDDAQVESHVAPVLPKVTGYVTEVLVADNEKVTAGQTLVRIDPRELSTKVDTAKAAVENAKATVDVSRATADGARASVAVARAAAAAARAQVATARVALQKAKDDLDRLTPLRKKEEISAQQYDAAVAARDAASAQLAAAIAQAEAAEAQVATAERNVATAERQVTAALTQVGQKKASLDESDLALSWVAVAAPATGVVAKKNVEVGQLVQAGQPLLAVVNDAEPWVVANFKETQVGEMRPGQPVEIEVDAYPGHSFHGRVDSLSGATGAKFALLPPDNATGNFVKVVQRVPVKVVLDGPADAARPLRAGMSVVATVTLD